MINTVSFVFLIQNLKFNLILAVNKRMKIKKSFVNADCSCLKR